jgi:hypothetical protein
MNRLMNRLNEPPDERSEEGSVGSEEGRQLMAAVHHG